MKKILLTLLAVFMFATAGTANVLAEDTTKNDIYVSFGDSITRGLGSEPGVTHDETEATDSNVRIVKDSYNALVAANYGLLQPEITTAKGKINADKYYVDGDRIITTKYLPVAAYGLTTKDVLDIIDGNPRVYYEGLGSVDVFTRYGAEGAEDVAAAIKGATKPLITLNTGLIDVAMYSSATDEFQGEMAKIFEAAGGNTEQALLSIIPAYEKAMFKAYLEWSKDYDKLVKELVSLRKTTPTLANKFASYNPYEIVLVGFFNPLRGVDYKISLDENKGYVYLPIGNILDPIIGLMNETSRFLAKKYGVKYADVYNGEGYAAAKEIALNDLTKADELSWSVHGTKDTYAYMARQIENAIDGTSYVAGSTDIVVDLVKYTAAADANKDSGFGAVYADKYTIILDGEKLEEELRPVGTVLTIPGKTDKTDKTHKLLNVVIETHGTEDDSSKNVSKTVVEVSKEYAKIDTAVFNKAQKNGAIVKLDADGNTNVIYNLWGTDVIAQAYNEKDVWVKCEDTPFTPDYDKVNITTKYGSTADSKLQFKADQEAGKIAKLTKNTDGKDVLGQFNHGKIVVVDYQTAVDEGATWVKTEPVYGEWLLKNTIVSLNKVPVKVDFAKDKYGDEPYTTIDDKAFKADQKAGLICLDVKYNEKTGYSLLNPDGTIETNDSATGWVVSEPTKDVNGRIIAVTPVTVTEQAQSKEVSKVTVLTYVLMWRGDHYEALNIDSMDDRDARIEKILSPITDPIVTWYTDWYNNLEFTSALEEFKDSVDTYNDAKDAIDDAKKAIDTAKAALEDAQKVEEYYKEAYKKASLWKKSEAGEKYTKAHEATVAATENVKKAYADAIDAVKAVIPTIDDAAKKGVEFAKEYSTWAYEFVTHIPDLFQ